VIDKNTMSPEHRTYDNGAKEYIGTAGDDDFADRIALLSALIEDPESYTG
jgi:hypothetical protein